MKKFIITFIVSYIILEFLEFLFKDILNIYCDDLKYWWIILMIIYGFKYHILCCVLPFIISTYRCKHKNKCDHNHCKK